ncbi:hypothetical protein quinque_012601 [Culex quinquefasciatus]
MILLRILLVVFCIGTTFATVDLISPEGYTVEQHETVTSDGYVLTMFRIPGTPGNSSRPVVFLQHGLLCSSTDWLVLGAGHSLAYLFADAGYDVWLGNARGNTHSRRHVALDPARDETFWDFSWHQIGLYDLPAMVDYALQVTGESALHYVGHSQGTTAFFVMTSLRPEYNGKIRSMQALAPVAFMGHLQSPFLRVLAPFVDQIEWITGMLGANEFLPSNSMLALGGQKFCQDTSPVVELCANTLFLIGGFNSAQLNRSSLPVILENTPAGASVKQLVHYAHNINSGSFRQFDYGWALNLVRYGSILPPKYPLDRVTAPVLLHYGENDWLAAISDVHLLARELGNLVAILPVSDRKWNHLDFTYAVDAKILLYEKVIDIVEQYKNLT